VSIEGEFIPQFETEEQEAEYWDTHSPLDLVAEPKAQKVRTRGTKDRPITIRLDSETRLKLDRLAAKRGLGPSTFARLILVSVIEQEDKLPKVITPDQLKGALESILEQMPQAIKERAVSLARTTAMGGLESPALLIIDASNRREWEEFTTLFLSALLAMGGVQVIVPEDSKYEKLKSIVGKKGDVEEKKGIRVGQS
jgi:antitoxin component of RelBE/YafQ-DinJ toxin-antitoxin module